MNLYYEDAPASEHDDPQLPPLLDAEKIAKGTDVMAKAIGRAAAGETGLVCYSEATHALHVDDRFRGFDWCAGPAGSWGALSVSRGDLI
ncbi:MAG: hypothetical protein VW554_06635 [Alphaproteobacteria bacterium]